MLPSNELPSSGTLVKPEDISKAISDSLIDLAPIFAHKKHDLDLIAKEFSEIVKYIEEDTPGPESGELGGCWLWILDNTNILTRALLSDSRIVVSESGKYLAELYEFSDFRSLRQRETMTQKLAALVSDKYSVECGYFSVLNSDDPDDLPFYNSDHLDNRMHYNVSWQY